MVDLGNVTNLLLVVVVAVVVLCVLQYFAHAGPIPNHGVVRANTVEDLAVKTPGAALPQHNEGPAHVNSAASAQVQQAHAAATAKASCYPKQQLTPGELLPADNVNAWNKAYPVGQGTLEGKNFLQAGHHVGINTVGQTLRNANLQLRSEPANPQVAVSPWQQSTIEPDVNRRPMEIGGCS